MSDFRQYLNCQMKSPDFRKEWDALEPEFQVIHTMIQARQEKNLTQKDLASLVGMSQGDISRLENGNANPSIKTLQRIADGLGMALRLEFVPKGEAR